MKRIHVAQNETIAAEVFDEDHGNFRLVLNDRTGGDLPPDIAPLDLRIYTSKVAAISAANRITATSHTYMIRNFPGDLARQLDHMAIDRKISRRELIIQLLTTATQK